MNSVRYELLEHLSNFHLVFFEGGPLTETWGSLIKLDWLTSQLQGPAYLCLLVLGV